MKFRVERMSEYSAEIQPCAEAIKTRVKRFDTRTCKSPEEFDERGLGGDLKWVERGTEHKILHGPRGGATGIQRRIEDEDGWVVHVDSLHALLALGEKYGDLIVSSQPAESNDTEDYIPSVEIYDGYRE